MLLMRTILIREYTYIRPLRARIGRLIAYPFRCPVTYDSMHMSVPPGWELQGGMSARIGGLGLWRTIGVCVPNVFVCAVAECHACFLAGG